MNNRKVHFVSAIFIVVSSQIRVSPST